MAVVKIPRLGKYAHDVGALDSDLRDFLVRLNNHQRNSRLTITILGA
jgi:hypothetical protein